MAVCGYMSGCNFNDSIVGISSYFPPQIFLAPTFSAIYKANFIYNPGVSGFKSSGNPNISFIYTSNDFHTPRPN